MTLSQSTETKMFIQHRLLQHYATHIIHTGDTLCNSCHIWINCSLSSRGSAALWFSSSDSLINQTHSCCRHLWEGKNGRSLARSLQGHGAVKNSAASCVCNWKQVKRQSIQLSTSLSLSLLQAAETDA